MKPTLFPCALPQAARDNVRYSLAGLSDGILGQMRVSLRCGWLTMTKKFPNEKQRKTACRTNARISVAEIVKADVFKTGAGADAMPRLLQIDEVTPACPR